MKYQSLFSTAKCVTGALAATLFLLTAAPARAQLRVVTSDAFRPYSGAFFDSATGESVTLAGSVDVVTRLTFSNDATVLTVYADAPANATATGQTSGLKYVINGANVLQFSYPPSPMRAAFARLQFTIFPPAPTHAPNPFYLGLQLAFTDDGQRSPPEDAGPVASPWCG